MKTPDLSTVNKPYVPIPCSFYDIIELSAMRLQKVLLVLNSEKGEEYEIKTTIVNTQTRKDGEYILTRDGEFRMDRIVSLNGIKPGNFC